MLPSLASLHCYIVARLLQAEWPALLRRHWPGRDFPWEAHTETDMVEALAENGSETEPEEQPMRERMAINRACYVRGLVCPSPQARHADVLLATQLWPGMSFKSVDEAMSDESFVFPPSTTN
jgi:hypothetical protein